MRKKPDVIFTEEQRGGHNKLFSEEEEHTLYESDLKTLYLDNYLFFDDECLGMLAGKKLSLIHPHPENEKLFTVSNGWIYDFKKRWNLSTLSASCSRKATQDITAHLQFYLESCSQIFKDYEPSLIFNMDETFWKTINGSLNVIGTTDSENRKLVLDVNFKEGFTAEMFF